MAEHVWSVLSERIIIDQRTNSISCLTCIEGVTAPQLPSTVPVLSIGSMWMRGNEEEKDFVFRLVSVRPDKSEKELIQGAQTLEPNGRGRVVIVMDGFPIEQTGRYVFRVETQSAGSWEIRAKLPMDVALRSQEQTSKAASDLDKARSKSPRSSKMRSNRSAREKPKARA